MKNILCKMPNTLMYDAVDIIVAMVAASSSFHNRLEGFVKYDKTTGNF